ncbi:MAG: TerB family tellurite resistance protein [Gemmatimonadota bacterium]
MKDVLFGLAAGAVGAAVWAGVVAFANYEIGWIAWGVGGLVGYAVAFGNSDRQRSPTAAGALAVGITVLSIVAGKYAAVQLVMPDDQEIVDMFVGNLEDEELAITYVADDVVVEFRQDERDVAWPEGVDPTQASSQADYPADVWAVAEERWAGWTEAERSAFRDEVGEQIRTNVEASLPEIRAAMTGGGFMGSFSPMDLLFFGLGMVTAWGVGSGKKSQEEIQGEYLWATKLAMLKVSLADGAVEDSEVETISSIYMEMTGLQLTAEEVRADAAMAGSTDLNEKLAEIGPHLNDDGRRSVVQAALRVALADGSFGQEEQHLVHGIARAVGLEDGQLRELIAEVSAQMQTPGGPEAEA